MKLYSKGKVKCVHSPYSPFRENWNYDISILEDGVIHIAYDSVHSCSFSREDLFRYFEGDYVTILQRKEKLELIDAVEKHKKNYE